MSDAPEPDACALCGSSISGDSIRTEEGQFCSPGCRDVSVTLDDPEAAETNSEDPKPAEANSDTIGYTHVSSFATPSWRNRSRSYSRQYEDRETDSDPAGGGESAQTFLRVDGMHSATCEAFLEAVAQDRDGVLGAEASYVTETIRVDHDPETVPEDDLADALTGAGYTAYLREEELIDTAQTRSAAGAQRDPSPHDERGLGDLLGYRYAAGVLFGTFLLLPYVALLYPAHLAALVDWPMLDIYTGTVSFDQRGGYGALRLFAVVSGIVLVFTGLPLLRGAYVSLKTRRPDTNLLVATTVIATYLYSIVAGVAGRTDVLFDLTVVIAAAVVAAVFYESLSKQRAMDRLTELTVAQVDEATVVHPEGPTRTVPVEEVEAGDRILVREGERAPVDGVLAEGTCTVDESVVTGESLPVFKEAGGEVVGGSVVVDGAAMLEASEGAQSSVDRLVTAVWELQSATHGVQRRANRLIARILPAVAILAVLAAGAAFVLAGPTAALLAFLATPVVACPWGLGLAGPISVATSIEEALRRGVVVFDETVFERLRAVDVVVFDKTGTLTTGEMHVVETEVPEDALAVAAQLERRVSHPVAEAIVSASGGARACADGGVTDELDGQANESETGESAVESFESYQNGVGGVVDGTDVLVGHPDRFESEGWTVSEELTARVERARGFGRLPVLVGRDGRAEGVVVVGDEPREGWDEAVTGLGERGVDVVVLTGDDEAATDYFREHPSVTHVYAGVPPAGKTETIRRLQAEGAVTMVGDGTNDAPALAAADLGISLGSGTAIASDAADLVIVEDDLAAVGRAIELARAAGRRLAWNNRFALIYNAVAVPLALAGVLNPLLVMGAVAASGGLIGANSVRDLIDERDGATS